MRLPLPNLSETIGNPGGSISISGQETKSHSTLARKKPAAPGGIHIARDPSNRRADDAARLPFPEVVRPFQPKCASRRSKNVKAQPAIRSPLNASDGLDWRVQGVGFQDHAAISASENAVIGAAERLYLIGRRDEVFGPVDAIGRGEDKAGASRSDECVTSKNDVIEPPVCQNCW